MATIDPPAADVAKRAQERHKAHLERLEANKQKRIDVQNKVESIFQETKSSLEQTCDKTAQVPVALAG